MRVVATAGHVDHGKSSLVLALTGTDPDRFPEEKARGLTSDLGFAFTTIGRDVVGFVDVPGHVKFVKNMLAGVGAVDVAMVIVAATEGWMPQSEEHVRILDLLAIRYGLIVVTKADLVDDETLELAQLELAEKVEGTALEHWPVVCCDSLSGRGLDDVRATLRTVLDAAPEPVDRGRPRLWVDRVFAAKGAGTVVTGTLTSGHLVVDDDVAVGVDGTARVRGLESHHEKLDRVAPGARVAVNLAGIDHTSVGRGDAVVRREQWRFPTTIDVVIESVPGQSLPRRGRLAAHIGSGEQGATWRLLDETRGLGRLRLDVAVPLAIGDRLILRSTGRRATIGGAVVVDVAPPRRTVDAVARFDLGHPRNLVHGRDWLSVDELTRLAGTDDGGAVALANALVESGDAVRIGDALIAAERRTELMQHACEQVTAHHRDQPHERGLDLATLAARLRTDVAGLRGLIETEPDLVVEREVVRRHDHLGRASDDPEGRRMVDALVEGGFSPPSADELGVATPIVRALVREGVVSDLDGVLFATAALDDARRLLARAAIERGSYTVADARDLLGTTRKYVLAIVNQLDREGVTRRRGDDRIPGPRAEAASTDTD